MKQALLIIDVQNDYFEYGKMELHLPENALQQINKLEDFFITNNLPIIYIQHIKDQVNADFFERGTIGSQLHERLKVNSSSIILEKQYPNSFFETNLKETLDLLKIDQVVLSGMMTHMCIDSTTRASKELGYNPILISDATATKTLEFQGYVVKAEKVQASFLSALEHFSQVISTDYYLK